MVLLVHQLMVMEYSSLMMILMQVKLHTSYVELTMFVHLHPVGWNDVQGLVDFASQLGGGDA